MTFEEAQPPLADDAVGDQTSEAFEILGNEKRLNVLLALWEADEPFTEDIALSFSALRARVDTTDSSQFNYHLDKLVGRFVRSTDAGYELTAAGHQFVRSVVAGVGVGDVELEPTDVDVTCTMCGGQVQLSYAEGWVRIQCSECDGLWTEAGEEPSGQLAKFTLEPAGLANRSPNEIYAAAWVHGFQHIHGMLEGVCPTCSGIVERELHVCADHEDEGVCANCHRTKNVGARAHCTVCKEEARMTPGVAAKYHPAVVGFFHDHGLDLQYGFNDLARIERRLEMGGSETELLAEDPPRVRVTHEIDGESVTVELDDDLSVGSVDS